jgi:uncharacterized membrane protein
MPTSYTGLPTLLGAHEREQRPWDQVEPRERDAVTLYITPDPGEFNEIAEKYEVRYIYVGQLERHLYAGAGLEKFQAMLHTGELAEAYANERVIIYQVPARTAATG